jgi:DNA invertase Pin-like site-specific DNA recombinase
MKAMGTDTAVYARVSTEEQSRSGLGIDAQIAAARQLAAVRGWVVLDEHIYVDEGISGTTPPASRPAMERLLAAAGRGEFANIIIFSLDRLAHRTRSILEFVDTLSGVGVAFYREQAVDTTTAAGRVVLGVLTAFAQFERDLTERTRDALAQKKEQGGRLGRLPFGYALTTDGVQIEEGKAEIVRWIFQQRDAGMSYSRIAAALNAGGTRPPGGKRWYPSGVRSIAVNAVAYAGGDGLPAILW